MKRYLIIAFLILASCQTQLSQKSSDHFAPPPSLPALSVVVPWTGETYDVPPPATIPDSFRSTTAYRHWQFVKDIEDLRIPLDDGRVLVAYAMGFALQDGQLYPMIPTMRVYRSDGTLELDQFNAPDLSPEEWTLYATDGKTKLVHVVNRTSGIANTPFIEYVDFYKEGNPDHQFAIHTAGQVTYDWQLKDEHSTGQLLHPTKKDPVR